MRMKTLFYEMNTVMLVAFYSTSEMEGKRKGVIFSFTSDIS